MNKKEAKKLMNEMVTLNTSYRKEYFGKVKDVWDHTLILNDSNNCEIFIPLNTIIKYTLITNKK